MHFPIFWFLLSSWALGNSTRCSVCNFCDANLVDASATISFFNLSQNLTWRISRFSGNWDGEILVQALGNNLDIIVLRFSKASIWVFPPKTHLKLGRFDTNSISRFFLILTSVSSPQKISFILAHLSSRQHFIAITLPTFIVSFATKSDKLLINW